MAEVIVHVIEKRINEGGQEADEEPEEFQAQYITGIIIWVVAILERGVLCCGGNNLAVVLTLIVFD